MSEVPPEAAITEVTAVVVDDGTPEVVLVVGTVTGVDIDEFVVEPVALTGAAPEGAVAVTAPGTAAAEQVTVGAPLLVHTVATVGAPLLLTVVVVGPAVVVGVPVVVVVFEVGLDGPDDGVITSEVTVPSMVVTTSVEIVLEFVVVVSVDVLICRLVVAVLDAIVCV